MQWAVWYGSRMRCTKWIWRYSTLAGRSCRKWTSCRRLVTILFSALSFHCWSCSRRRSTASITARISQRASATISWQRSARLPSWRLVITGSMSLTLSVCWGFHHSVGFLLVFVRSSTKSFCDLNEIWCVGRGRWVVHNSMPYDLIQGQGQGHGGLKCTEMADFKGYLYQNACNQKTNGELWYSKTV